MKFVKLTIVYLLLLIGSANISLAQPNYITTVAGGQNGYGGDNGPAIAAQLSHPGGVWVDNAGNIYIADQGNYRIRKVNTSGIITTIAGNGIGGYSGDGGPATAAQISYTEGPVGVDNAGNVYIADRDNDRVRRVDGITGIITTYAGTGSGGYSGDGGPASAAQLSSPISITFDAANNMYVAERGNHVVRKITPGGIISTVAGNGNSGFSGDGGSAVQAQIGEPKNLCFNPAGNMYIGDFDNNRIRKVDVNGIITTFAGNGVAGYSGDGGLATQAQICNHWGGVASDNVGNIYIGDMYNHVVRKVDLSGIITTIAGTGTGGYSGDGGPAISAELESPVSLIVGPDGDLYVNDQHNHAIRKIEIEPTYSADSFNVYLSKDCAGISMNVTRPYYAPGMTVQTYFGDGTNTTSTFQSGYIVAYASIAHQYSNTGDYLITQYVYNGSTLIDSASYSHHHHLCATMAVHYYNDMNSNCNYDAGNDIILNIPFLVEVDSNSTPIDTVTCTSGFTYTAYGSAGDAYSFKLIEYPADLVSCNGNLFVNDVLQAGVNPTKYMGMNCVGGNGFDLLQYIDSRAGSHAFESYIDAQNLYCSPQNAVLTMTYQSDYNFITSTPPPTSQTATTASWNIGGLSSVAQQGTIHVRLDGAQFPTGIPVSTTYSITPTTGDVVTANNMVVVIDTTSGSFDPNAIYVKPAGCVDAGTNLEYTITFENLGNGPAENIYVLDTLPAHLNASSMKMLFASHTMFVEKIYNGPQTILKFNFPNIMLPDSSDHAGRHGSLKYTIDVKDGLSYGTNFQHRAGIYFDYNDPVMTNEAPTSICWPQQVIGVAATTQDIRIYPNPATEELTIRTEQTYTSYIITNSIGQVMMEQNINSKDAKVNIRSLSTGIYYLSLKGQGGTVVRKFVKL